MIYQYAEMVIFIYKFSPGDSYQNKIHLKLQHYSINKIHPAHFLPPFLYQNCDPQYAILTLV